jgi:cytoplasmic iron level regulating protein YaaA (DUF328/UPF0246 family)
MKIIVSPSKTQNLQATLSQSEKLLIDQANTLQLFQVMKSMSKPTLAKLTKLEGSLLDEIYDLYRNFEPTHPMVRAIDCYRGVVFQEIKSEQYNAMQRTYMNEHLIILSAMYGVLEPDIPIWPYRLDLTMKPTGINLYTYWQKTIDTYFAQEDLIINLASEEFNKWLKPYHQQILHIHFRERKADGELKVISYYAKQARGRMAHQLITHQLENVETIKELAIENYRFEESLSNSNHFYFVKG